jgi:hypothetical protein
LTGRGPSYTRPWASFHPTEQEIAAKLVEMAHASKDIETDLCGDFEPRERARGRTGFRDLLGRAAADLRRGGPLHQHLPDAVGGSRAPALAAGRSTSCGSPGSRLARVLGTLASRVNSLHSLAARTLGPALGVA